MSSTIDNTSKRTETLLQLTEELQHTHLCWEQQLKQPAFDQQAHHPWLHISLYERSVHKLANGNIQHQAGSVGNKAATHC
jgi:hypothetical protein